MKLINDAWEMMELIALIFASTVFVVFTVCFIYGIVRITFMVIQDYKEDREMRKIGKQQKHIDQR